MTDRDRIEMHRSLTDYQILCLSHLPWETTLFQRPQQLMSCFDAMGVRVSYLSQWSSRRWLAAVLAGQCGKVGGKWGSTLRWCNLPYFPGAHRWVVCQKAHLLCSWLATRLLIARHRKRPTILWTYHPSFLPVIRLLPFEALVYDCMDPFVEFRAESRKLSIARQEHELLRCADVVFTGGPSLHAARRGVNANTYCFPSGVDLDHFGRALDERAAPPPDVANLPRPILGYWGAVDERLDFSLVERLCRRWPNSSVVFLGPLVGMERPPLDQPNFHHLGAREYAQLPAYLAAFDVCLMPFAGSALTASISPTKTPEYLAGGRPVVSTAVPDVIAMWADVVSIGETADAFVEAVGRELSRPRPDLRLVEAARQRAKSWDETAQQMRDKIEAIVEEKNRQQRTASA